MLARTALCATLAVGAVVLLCSNDFWVWAEGIGAVELTRNLPANTSEMQNVFDARIKTRFPIGSPTADMLHELGKEGFVVNDKTFPPDDEHYATRRDGGNGACSFSATVFWRSIASDQITSIMGRYKATCL